MRYFLVTFHIKDVNSIGTMALKSEVFPSHSSIKKEVLEVYNMYYEVVITNFFEFKNEEDYLNYLN